MSINHTHAVMNLLHISFTILVSVCGPYFFSNILEKTGVWKSFKHRSTRACFRTEIVPSEYNSLQVFPNLPEGTLLKLSWSPWNAHEISWSTLAPSLKHLWGHQVPQTLPETFRHLWDRVDPLGPPETPLEPLETSLRPLKVLLRPSWAPG